MTLSTRYGLVGIGALALLSGIHWLRGMEQVRDPAWAYLLGVLPNLAAALAITFVLLSIWADHDKTRSFTALRQRFITSASISGFGLLGWELVQKASNRFVFDLHDIGATAIGIGLAGLLFYGLTPRTTHAVEQGGLESRAIRMRR